MGIFGMNWLVSEAFLGIWDYAIAGKGYMKELLDV